MGDDRYSRDDQQRDAYGRQEMQGRTMQGQGRDDRYRGYGSQREDDWYRGGEYGHQRYGQREQMNRGIDYGRGNDGGRDSFGGGRDYYGGDQLRSWLGHRR